MRYILIISDCLLDNSIWMSHRHFVVKTKLIFSPDLWFFTAVGGTITSPCHQDMDFSTCTHPTNPQLLPISPQKQFLTLFHYLFSTLLPITIIWGAIKKIPKPRAHLRPFKSGLRHQYLLKASQVIPMSSQARECDLALGVSQPPLSLFQALQSPLTGTAYHHTSPPF